MIVPTLRLGAVQVLALGCMAIAIGAWLKKKFPLLDRLCIPTSIVGGMLFALIALALHARQINFEADTTLRDLMMVAFMTTIGLNARLELVRRGGVKVLLMLGLASCGAMIRDADIAPEVRRFGMVFAKKDGEYVVTSEFWERESFK